MTSTWKGKGTVLLQGAAIMAIAAGLGSEMAMAGNDQTFNTALLKFTGWDLYDVC